MTHRLTHSIGSVRQDLVVGLRVLRRNPAVSVSAVAVLGLTIGLSMALVSLLDRLLVRPLPVDCADRFFQLVRPGARGGVPQESFRASAITPLRAAVEPLGTILVVGYPGDELVSYGGAAFQPEPVRLQSLDVRALEVLGVRPVMGRGFQSGDSAPGAEPVAILSYDYWQRRFGGAPDALGKLFGRRGRQVRIIGILPGRFPELDLGHSPDAWLPAAQAQGGRMLVVLRPGAGPLQMEASLRPAWEDYLQKEPLPPGQQRDARQPAMSLRALDASKGLRSGLRSQFATPLTTVTLAAILLLLIGCSNSGLLLVALHDGRREEMAIRMALGASRRRLVRQVVVETTALSAASCLLGAILAPIASSVLLGLASDPDRPIRLAWQWDWRFALVAIAFCSFVTALSAALPALRLPGENTGASSRGLSPFFRLPHTGFPSGALFVAGQACLAVVLLVGGGLLQTTRSNLERLDPGFDQQRLSIAELQWEREGNREYTNSVYRTLLAQVAGLPEVARVSLSGWSYFGGNSRRASILPESPSGAVTGDLSEFLSISPGFFTTMGVRLLGGRDFSDADTQTSPLVAILNESAARLYFGNGSALGHRFSIFDPKQKLEIVGVVEDTRLNGLREAAPPMIYLPFFQSEFRGTSDMPASLEIRALPGRRLPLPELSRVIQCSAPGLAVRRLRPQRELVERSLLRERLLSVVSVTLGLFALLLTGLGLSGTVAHAVASRQREFGIRLALGATAGRLIGAGLRQAILPVCFGILPGSFLALILARLLKSMLFGIAPSDPFVQAGAALLLLLVSAAAALVPLTGTMRIDPATSLRQE
ncbi:ABC transporter permease [Paludibaculum fermentans]|uniref:ABC transporter permease n=1 Tax=Paludibaculum fermentans TaxID=1473598 RepID=UPI003EBD06C0